MKRVISSFIQISLAISIFSSTNAFSSEVKDFRFYCDNLDSIPKAQQLIPRTLIKYNPKLNCNEIFQKYQENAIYLDLPPHPSLTGQQVVSFAPLKGFPLIEVLSAKNYIIEDISALASIYTIFDLHLTGSHIKGGKLDIAGGNLDHIRTLYIDGTNIKSLDSISTISVFILNISNTGISTLNFLSNRELLGELIAQNNNITDASPLAPLQGLSTLDLSGNAITDISAINSKYISHLDLSDNPLGDEGVKSLTLWVRVYALSLKNTGITNVDFLGPHQTEIGDWEFVDLSNNPITNLDGLAGHTSLYGTGRPVIEYLNISSTLVNKDDVPQDILIYELINNDQR